MGKKLNYEWVVTLCYFHYVAVNDNGNENKWREGEK